MKHRPFEKYFQQNPTNFPEEPDSVPHEKRSGKEIDIFCRELLARNPELERKIISQMGNLGMQDAPMPIIHITGKAIKRGNEMVSTGFVENIEGKGLRKRDTNVGAFIKRGKEVSIAKPDFFEKNPGEFIKSLRLFLQKYLHHGIRTNKQALGELRDSERAVPAMIFIEGDVKLEHGSDYDDHYILREDVAPEQIIGSVDLSEHQNYRSEDDITYIAEKLLELASVHYR